MEYTVGSLNLLLYYSVRWVVPTWEKYWGEAIEAAKQKQGGKAGIFWVLVKSFWPTFLLGALYQFVYVGLQFASPQILGLIISFVVSTRWRRTLSKLFSRLFFLFLARR